MESTPRILLAEDDPSVRLIFQTALRPLGAEIVTAEDGQAALDSAREKTPDLVVLDLMMPKLNGFQFLRRFREEHGDDVPVIVVSAKSGTMDREWATRLGVAEFLVKPITPTQLAEAIAPLLPLPAPHA